MKNYLMFSLLTLFGQLLIHNEIKCSDNQIFLDDELSIHRIIKQALINGSNQLASPINLKNKCIKKLWFEAIMSDNQQLSKLLLANGVEINIQDESGYTALMIAIANNSDNSQLINFLLRNGAELNITNNKNQTAYDIAMEFALNAKKKYQESKHQYYKKLFKNNYERNLKIAELLKSKTP